jgi:hypothetical protein
MWAEHLAGPIHSPFMMRPRPLVHAKPLCAILCASGRMFTLMGMGFRSGPESGLRGARGRARNRLS